MVKIQLPKEATALEMNNEYNHNLKFVFEPMLILHLIQLGNYRLQICRSSRAWFFLSLLLILKSKW